MALYKFDYHYHHYHYHVTLKSLRLNFWTAQQEI